MSPTQAIALIPYSSEILLASFSRNSESEIPLIIRFEPAEASLVAIAFPIPRDDPVTIEIYHQVLFSFMGYIFS